MKKTFILIFILTSIFSLGQKREINLLTDSVAIGDNYTTRQIIFDTDQWTLKVESSLILDSIINFMKKHNKIIIEVQVHLDSRTKENYSDLPSQKRAEEIAKYLTQHGISSERLIAKGYGTRMLLFSDKEIKKSKTKEEQKALHAKNRRCVFKIIDFTK